MAKNTNDNEFVKNATKQEILDKASNEAVKELSKAKGITPEQLLEKVNTAQQRANVNELGLLIIKKYQRLLSLRPGLDAFVSMFVMNISKDGDKANGLDNIQHLSKSPELFNPGAFIPSTISEVYFAHNPITLYGSNGQLNPTSKQLLNKFVYQEDLMFQAFLKGQLKTFIAMQYDSQINQSKTLFLYDDLLTTIKNTTLPTINGSATTAFESWTTEIIPNLVKFTLNTSQYNIAQAGVNLNDKIYNHTNKDNIILLMTAKTYATLKTNLRSQVYNLSQFDIMDFVGQIHIVNDKFVVNTTGAMIETNHTTANLQYLDDNTVIALDKDLFYKYVIMVDTGGSDKFPLNLSTMKVVHTHYAKGLMVGAKAFKYTNNNLNTVV